MLAVALGMVVFAMFLASPVASPGQADQRSGVGRRGRQCQQPNEFAPLVGAERMRVKRLFRFLEC